MQPNDRDPLNFTTCLTTKKYEGNLIHIASSERTTMKFYQCYSHTQIPILYYISKSHHPHTYFDPCITKQFVPGTFSTCVTELRAIRLDLLLKTDFFLTHSNYKSVVFSGLCLVDPIRQIKHLTD